MAKPAASHRSTAIRALTVFSVLAVLVVDVGGYACPPFSCGSLSNISSPFRRQGDPPGCGVQSYELACSDTKAIINIGSGTYYVIRINYTDSSFWVVDTNLSVQSSCALPRWCFHARGKELDGRKSWSSKIVLAPTLRTRKKEDRKAMFSTFVNCSRTIKNNGMYRPVACLSTNCSFIYVLTGEYSYFLGNLEPSCHYLAMTPLGSLGMIVPPENASYAEVVKFMRNGFPLQFPFSIYEDYCAIREITNFGRIFFGAKSNGATYITKIKNVIADIIFVEFLGGRCIMQRVLLPSASEVWRIGAGTILLAIWTLKSIAVIFRFMLVPLAIFTFLAHKYWKTKIRIDAIEKFLRMQQMICGPLRYAYTDITAITSHFREKLGQGGYGSVYKGVLPGNVHVAIKMLSTIKCNGEEFISEVSTIGKIHHVNVLRLVGFCSEEMRRALVYEYMPNGSLDKYIFSLEKSFSWDKLNEIAVGIARGINYLHQGCDVQILHFDIKPHNILLDRNFVPKVADFGLAKLFPRDNTFVPLSAMRGTIGYIAPEMVSRSFGSISSKSDVYSFGMLLLEMAGGRRNADPNVANSSQNYYPSWVYDKLIEQQVGEISIFHMHELEKKLCIVGLWCIQMRSHDRPTMSEVIEILESGINGLEVPSRPFFCDGGEQIPIVDSYYLSSELDDIQEEVE